MWKSRTEAIANLDNTEVYWDSEDGAYIDEKDIIHLPQINDLEISDKDIKKVRGFVDHEVRHKRYTFGWNDYIPEFKKNMLLKQICNCLEDARIDAIQDKPGETLNIYSLREEYLNEYLHKLEKETKTDGAEYANAISSYMYRTHFKFDLPEDVEKAYSELSPYFDKASKAKNLQDVYNVSKEIYEFIKDKIKMEEQEQKYVTRISMKPVPGTDSDESKTSLINTKLEAIAKDIEKELIETILSEDIKTISKSSMKISKFTNYTDGDYIYKYKKNDAVSNQFKSNNSKLSTMTKIMATILRSKTSKFKFSGFKKGKRIAKNKLGLFSCNLTDAPFYKVVNTEKIHAKVVILVDMSGSMVARETNGKSRFYNALYLAKIISKSLSMLGIEFSVIGFSSDNPDRDWIFKHCHKSKNYVSCYPKFYEIMHDFKDKYSDSAISNVMSQALAHHADYEFQIPGLPSSTENNDGESVEYAAKHLLKNSSPIDKKILFVLSDGTPQGVINEKYSKIMLHDYLKHVVNKIMNETDIELFAFGFGGSTKIEKYYGKENSIYAKDVENLEESFLKNLKNKLIASLS